MFVSLSSVKFVSSLPPTHPHTQPNIPSVAGSPAVASLFPTEEEVRIAAQERAALPQEPFCRMGTTCSGGVHE